MHELDSDRGPTLEMVLTRLRFMAPNAQIVALSATIPNAKELSQWLDAQLIESDFRPVQLREGVYFDQKIHFKKGFEPMEDYKEPLHAIVKNTLEQKAKQCLVFANTRKRAESMAKELSHLTERSLNAKEKTFLKKKSEEVLGALESPTEQCAKLASLVEKGVAFHHAGLVSRQREIVEELFKSNHLKALSATPTLAAGINLPAFRVIVPTLFRYSDTGGNRIPVREWKQMAGRAGRPKYDSVGEAILIARSELEMEELFLNYIDGTLEPIESKLSIQPILRSHVLSSIASNFVFDLDSMQRFFSKTFFAHQYKDSQSLYFQVSDIISQLQDMGFVVSDSKKIEATALGKRVSELYLDPQSAFNMVSWLKKGLDDSFAFLFLLTQCFEFYPLVSPGKESMSDFMESMEEEKRLPIELDKALSEDLDFPKRYATALALEQWVLEKPEQQLLKEFNLQPGLLRGKIDRGDWLLYSAIELSKQLGLKESVPLMEKLRKRLKYGVKDELLKLVELRGIGRVRGRKLFNAGIQSVSDVKKADFPTLSKWLGHAVALQLKQQLGQEVKESEKKSVASPVGQSALGDF